MLTVHLNIFILILTNLMHEILYKFISCLYMFRAHMLIVRRSQLYYTASGIITLKKVSGVKLLNYFSNFRPLTCFSMMIPEAVQYNSDLLTMSTCARNM